MEIRKPLVYPRIERDEGISRYLRRVAFVNGYEKINYLKKVRYAKSATRSGVLEQAASCTPWVKMDEQEKDSFEFNHLPTSMKVRKLRWCPLCLKQDRYWKASWQCKASIACEIHKVWLVDVCSYCSQSTDKISQNYLMCDCQHPYEDVPADAAHLEAILLQKFLNTGKLHSFNKIPLIQDNVALSVQDRVTLFLLVGQYASTSSESLRRTVSEFQSIDTLKPIISTIGLHLLYGEYSFFAFTTHLGRRRYNKDFHTTDWSKFWIGMDKQCQHPFFKDLLLKVKQHRLDSGYYATKRNGRCYIDTSLRHRWLPIDECCRFYGLYPSCINAALKDGIIDYSKEQRGGRTFTLVDIGSVFAKLDFILEFVCLANLRDWLGFTKKQVSKLVHENFFDSAIPPTKGVSSVWRISMKEVESIFAREGNWGLSKHDKWMTFSEIMRKYSRAMPDIFTKILNDMKKNPKLFSKGNIRIPFKEFRFEINELESWIFENSSSEGWTITEAAKLAKIHHECMYQLVNGGWIDTTLERNRQSRVITEENLEAFQSKYITETQLAHEFELPQSLLRAQFKSAGVAPIGHYGGAVNMRMKIYEREAVMKVLT